MSQVQTQDLLRNNMVQLPTTLNILIILSNIIISNYLHITSHNNSTLAHHWHNYYQQPPQQPDYNQRMQQGWHGKEKGSRPACLEPH